MKRETTATMNIAMVSRPRLREDPGGLFLRVGLCATAFIAESQVLVDSSPPRADTVIGDIVYCVVVVVVVVVLWAGK
jgi:hypothetical protein